VEIFLKSGYRSNTPTVEGYLLFCALIVLAVQEGRRDGAGRLPRPISTDLAWHGTDKLVYP